MIIIWLYIRHFDSLARILEKSIDLKTFYANEHIIKQTPLAIS